MEAHTVSPAVAFADNILKALKLRREFNQRIDDFQNWKSRSSNVFYAIDPSVLSAYFHPLTLGSDKHASSMQIYKAPDGDTALADRLSDISPIFASTVARFVINELCVIYPGLLLNGHMDEAIGIHKELIDHLSETPGAVRSKKQKLRALLHKFRSNDPDAAFTLNDARDEVWNIYTALKSPHDGATQFHDLLLSGKITSVDLATDSKNFAHLKLNDEPHPFLPQRDEVHSKAKRLYNSWSEAEERAGLARKAGRVSDELAQENRALARLFAINRRLEGNAKVVLVTLNDDTIRRASNIREASTAEALEDNRSFADKYIRHLRTFMCEPMLMSPPKKNIGEVYYASESIDTDWLDAMLASFDDDSDISRFEVDDLLFRPEARMRLINTAHRALERDPEIHVQFVSKWADYLSSVCSKHAIHSNYISQAVGRILTGEESDDKRYIDRLQEHVNNLTEESWIAFFDVSAKAGLDLITRPPSSTDIIKRNLPHVIFTHHENASNVAELLVNGMELDTAKEMLTEEVMALELEDSTGYTRTINSALLFAFADRWDVADLLARRAVAIYRKVVGIKNLGELSRSDHPIHKDKISGREALFAAASFGRVRAETYHDIHRVRQLLNSAAAALSAEQTAATNSGRMDEQVLQMTGTRFDAEFASIEVTGLMLSLYGEPNKKTFLEGVRPLETEKDTRVMARLFAENALNQSLAVLNKLNDEPESVLKARTTLCMLTNIFMTLFASESADIAVKALPKGKLEDLARLSYELNGGYEYWLENADGNGKIVPSRLDRMTCIYALARFGAREELPPINFLRRELNMVDFLCRTHDQAIYSTAYDEKRYKAIILKTREALNKLGHT